MGADFDDADRTSAVGLARYAYEYIAAARVVDSHHADEDLFGRVPPVPAYFLALHGIELTLKAFLRHEGISLRDLVKHYQHDLRACYRKSKELGLKSIFNMRADDLRAFLMLLELNEFQGLRYIRTGFKRFPSWAIVEPLSVRLHQAVAKRIGAKSFSICYPAYERNFGTG